MKRAEPIIIPIIQYVIFALLVMATPLVVVTKYLQGAVYNISHMSFTMLGVQLPFVVAGAAALFIAFVIWQRRNITLRRVVGVLVVAAMVAFSQWVMDLYGGMSVYDLQKNWHYVAYTAYVFIFFRTFNFLGLPANRRILYSFFSAVALSATDEFFQFFASNRIFDVCDIAKDSWGAMMGLVLVLFVSETYGRLDLRSYSIWKRRLADYGKDPLTALVITGLLSLSAVTVSPLLTGHEYWRIFLLFTAAAYILLFAVLHLLQFRGFRMAFVAAAAALLIWLSGTLVVNRNENVTHAGYGLTVYRGVPVPFFDLMIYPNGALRLVDKKHFFNNQDKQFFLRQKPHILLVGSGWEGKGGKGFTELEMPHFIFNRNTLKGTQVIIQKTPEACRTFNRLKAEGRNVLFVIHNTC